MRKIRYFTILLFVMLSPNILHGAEINLKEASITINDLLFKYKYNDAERLIRKCIKQKPTAIYFLSRLEVVLNAQNKYKEADELSTKIDSIWATSHKENKKTHNNSPDTSNHIRVLVPAKEYNVWGAEFFQPVKMKLPLSTFKIELLYTLTASPKSKTTEKRHFVLEMDFAGVEKSYVLKEWLANGKQHMFFSYGTQKPHIREVANDVVEYLNKETKHKRSILPNPSNNKIQRP